MIQPDELIERMLSRLDYAAGGEDYATYQARKLALYYGEMTGGLPGTEFSVRTQQHESPFPQQVTTPKPIAPAKLPRPPQPEPVNPTRVYAPRQGRWLNIDWAQGHPRVGVYSLSLPRDGPPGARQFMEHSPQNAGSLVHEPAETPEHGVLHDWLSEHGYDSHRWSQWKGQGLWEPESDRPGEQRPWGPTDQLRQHFADHPFLSAEAVGSIVGQGNLPHELLDPLVQKLEQQGHIVPVTHAPEDEEPQHGYVSRELHDRAWQAVLAQERGAGEGALGGLMNRHELEYRIFHNATGRHPQGARASEALVDRWLQHGDLQRDLTYDPEDVRLAPHHRAANQLPPESYTYARPAAPLIYADPLIEAMLAKRGPSG